MAAHKRQVIINCAVCGIERSVRQSQVAKIRTCGAKTCLAVIYKRRVTGRKHSEETKRKQSLVKQKKQCLVPCSCGCGQMFTLPQYRVKATQKRFFVDKKHRQNWLEYRAQTNWLRGERAYGPGWGKAQKLVRERDKICQRCGKTPEQNGMALDVHHIVAFRISHDNNPVNLTALCRHCHLAITRTEVGTIPDSAYPTYEYTCTCSVCGDIFICDNQAYTLCSSTCRHLKQMQWDRESRKRARQEGRESAKKRRAYLAKYQREHTQSKRAA